jgi:hypothetical protein
LKTLETPEDIYESLKPYDHGRAKEYSEGRILGRMRGCGFGIAFLAAVWTLDHLTADASWGALVVD